MITGTTFKEGSVIIGPRNTTKMALSVVTVFLMTPGVGRDAAYPDFKSENQAQAVTSFGGLLFMLLAAGFIAAVVVLDAGPVYQLFMADFHGRSLSGWQWAWLIASFALVLLLPMRFGERRLRG